MGKQNEEFIIILDIDRVFSADELALVTSGKEAAAGLEAEEASSRDDS